ncbi:conserved hypothetical protein [Gloeothece citriformis PCC 7424]|uniref:vWA-MoxR associated protein N-terminal HTH domain-containing protein n=1 Tax=Gloeothece citriformis (strain PCC 7424) TaxID=65393 RepID=B7KEB7_GLOC7|nr:AAA-like domain-containing protein [Gloeothece citriformis]ACK73235.1 conserved hypothetical protein [Gloeothece citriformis PCC 7424]
MNLDYILEIVNRCLIESQNRSLNSLEILILQGIWEEKTYSKIALENGYSPGYLTNVVAPEMYRRLSELVGQRVTKKNCQQLLQSYVTAKLAPLPYEQNRVTVSPKTNQDRCFSYPRGSIPLDSPYYLKRSPMEDHIYQELLKPGALVRIKAPSEMGKTSLLLRCLDYAKRQGYYSVNLNLELVDEDILKNLPKFLRWLCANISHQLEIKPKLDEYWDEDLGSKVSCTAYFQDYLLKLVDSPLVLGLDQITRIFEYSDVAQDFLLLLRFWHEEAKIRAIWQKLRLIVVHSTEIYVTLQIHQSPFNVGLPIQLKPFTLQEIQQLAQCYQLHWKGGEEAKQLIALVGGHPALIHIALYHLSCRELKLGQLLETTAITTEIYRHHLQRLQIILQEQRELASAFNTVISAKTPVEIEPILAYKLQDLGLIKLLGNKVMPTCELYRHYFYTLIRRNSERGRFD